MLRLAVALPKGGVGKTSTAVNLAHGLALRGRQVLLVDCDEAGAAGRALGVSPSAGLAELVDGRRAADCLTEARPGLWLIAGGPALASTKRDIARRDLGAERVLAEALERVALAADCLILDTAPAWDAMAINALWVARRVLAPVELEPLAVASLPGFVDKIGQVSRYRAEPFAPLDILPSRLDRRVKQAGDILGQLQRYYPGQVLEPIPGNVAISQSQARGLTIWEYAARSPAAVAYGQLVDHYMREDSEHGEE